MCSQPSEEALVSTYQRIEFSFRLQFIVKRTVIFTFSLFMILTISISLNLLLIANSIFYICDIFCRL
jgi:hypothetical protein